MSIAILLSLVHSSILMQKLEDENPTLINYIYFLIPRTLKTASNKQIALINGLPWLLLLYYFTY
jgi:hypothetical protein